MDDNHHAGAAAGNVAALLGVCVARPHLAASSSALGAQLYELGFNLRTSAGLKPADVLINARGKSHGFIVVGQAAVADVDAAAAELRSRVDALQGSVGHAFVIMPQSLFGLTPMMDVVAWYASVPFMALAPSDDAVRFAADVVSQLHNGVPSAEAIDDERVEHVTSLEVVTESAVMLQALPA